MEIILNGCSSPAERFSQIDIHLVQKEMANVVESNGKKLPAFKKDGKLTVKISTFFYLAIAN